MITRRRLLILVALLLAVGVGTVAWTLAGLPPVKYYIRYGLDPYCEPTGERVTYEGVEFVEIGPGIFRMGSTYLAEGGDWLGNICAPLGLPWGNHPGTSDEMPVHWVEFRKGYWIAATEITNAQYERFDKDHERNTYSEGAATPVVDVSWTDAQKYCAWIRKASGHPIRLPSEAEWECACRAGSGAEFTFGDDEESLSEYAWFDGNSDGRAHAVATKSPNPWGLSDLHGNVWEWCEDTYYRTYEGAPSDGSPRKDGGERWESRTPRRILRGGCWYIPGRYARSGFRRWRSAELPYWLLGFRPAFCN